MRVILSAFLLLALSACSNVPKNIKSPPVGDIQLNQVLLNKQSSKGKLIRWGGEIVDIENTADLSIIQVVQFPLNHYGKPQTNKNSQGRFIARSLEFLDPVVFKKGSLITLTGIATTETTKRRVDERAVIMPIVDVTSTYRWQPYKARSSSYYHDPFYYPYHSFYYGSGYRPRFGYRFYYH